jgi:hypothetical protein
VSAVVMLELDHQKVRSPNAAVASKKFRLKHDIWCDNTGLDVDSGQRRVWD